MRVEASLDLNAG